MKNIILILSVTLFGCLKANRSPYDMSTPTGFGMALFSQLSLSPTTNTNTTTPPTTNTTSSYTIGGNITGFTSGTLILQLNGGSDISLTPASTYQAGTVSSGAAYTVAIKSNPTGLACGITNATGTATANVTNADISCSTAALGELYPVNGKNWNEYINRDFSKDIFSQTDTPCTSTTGGYSTCVHAGEIRKFDLPSRSSCTNLTASDSAGALNWICKTNSTTGGVTFYSSALKKGKGLSDLIDWTTNGWKSLTFTVMDGTTTLMQTAPSTTWWGNGFATVNSTTFAAGQINLFTNAYTGTLAPNVSKAILLFKSTSSSSIVDIGTIACGIGVSADAINFTWIEGKINLSGSNRYGIYLNGAKYTVLRNVGIQNAGAGSCIAPPLPYGIIINASTNNLLENVSVANTVNAYGGTGIYLSGSSYNSLIDIVSANNYSNGIEITASSTNNMILGAVTMNNSNGIALTSTKDNLFLNITAPNNGTHGFSLVTSVTNNFYANLSLANNTDGLFLPSGNWDNNTIQNIFFLSGSYDVQVSTGNNNFFTGVLKRFSSGSGCQFTSGTNQGLVGGNSCNKQGLSDFNSSNGGVAYIISSMVGTFGGLSALDTKNTTSGLSGSVGTVSVTDWLTFDSYFKGVGKYNSNAFPNSFHKGKCTSGTDCTIWDFSLKSSDTVLLNANMTSGTGCPIASSTFSHTWETNANGSINQAYCSATYLGSVASNISCVTTVLRNTVELIADGVGNDNGICESNEDCLLTPNIGAYQGHGNIVSASTVGSKCADIPTLGIKLYQYETNGY